MADDRATRIRVLVADDDDLIRQIVAITLGDEAFDLSQAEDGEEALVATRTVRPHLAVLDVAMPRVSGFEVCRRIKADPELAATRVILLISAHRPNDAVNAKAAGADDSCAKPFSPLALMSKIQSVLRSPTIP